MDIPLSMASCQLPVAHCPLHIDSSCLHAHCLKAPATPLPYHTMAAYGATAIKHVLDHEHF